MFERHTDWLDAAAERTQAEADSAVAAILAKLPKGESAHECDECGAAIPEARRLALPGVRLCVGCQSAKEGRRG